MSGRCVLIIGGLGAGGAERVCVNVANQWAREGKVIDLIVLDGGSVFFADQLDPRIRCHHLPVRHARDLLPMASRLLARWPDRPWLCFGHQLAVPLLLARLARAGRRPRIVTRCLNNLEYESRDLGGFWHHRIAPLAARLVLRRSDAVICQTRAMRRDLARSMRIPLARQIVLRNPLGRDFQDTPVHDLPQHGPVLVVGRLAPQKDPLLAVAVMALATAREPAMRLRWVGSGAMRDEFLHAVARAGLADKITWGPARADIIREYDQARLLMCCSRYEGYGNVLIEAIARGRPVVAIDCPHGPAEIVTPENGLLVRGRDPQVLADALVSCWRRAWVASAVAASQSDHDSAAAYWSALTGRTAVDDRDTVCAATGHHGAGFRR